MKYQLLILCFLPILGVTQENGETIFKMNCASCHSIGKGKLVGPDLEGVRNRRNENWLKQFINSPQKMIGEGDTVAVALFQEYNFIPMPDQSLSNTQIEQVLDYISSYENITSNAPAVSSNDFQKEPKQPVKDTGQFIENTLFNPLFWIAATVLILFFLLLITMSNVIKILAKELTQSEKEKKELLTERNTKK